ncbi:MAG: AbrB/MazE/SpoVT family DNA-binding domain-containing protein [Deltaproteobacteria bacterium]|nr:AbrB/MazE/SpoVT family DNA-binding domain-containing protein [Deltaproteobacteria bacterium]
MPIISSEGQILIPKFVRDVLSISSGDEVDFQISGNQVFLCKKKHKKKSFRKYFGYLSNLQGANPDKIIEELRGKSDDISS